MKKATLENILTILETRVGLCDEFVQEVTEEVRAELTKGNVQKAKNAEAYEALHDVIVDNLGETPCTVAELWDVIKDKVPDDMTKGRVQYALTHLWQDEIVKVEGKPNGYRKA